MAFAIDGLNHALLQAGYVFARVCSSTMLEKLYDYISIKSATLQVIFRAGDSELLRQDLHLKFVLCVFFNTSPLTLSAVYSSPAVWRIIISDL